LNKLPKEKQLAAKSLGKKNSKCSTVNCDGKGNTREAKYGWTNHTSVKYCPNRTRTCVPSANKENINLDYIERNRISATSQENLLDKTSSLEIFKNIEELKVQIRSLENDKRLGNLIKTLFFHNFRQNYCCTLK